MTDEEYLRACGWVQNHTWHDGHERDDGTVGRLPLPYWYDPFDRGTANSNTPTAEAVAIQIKRDRDRFCFVVERAEKDEAVECSRDEERGSIEFQRADGSEWFRIDSDNVAYVDGRRVEDDDTLGCAIRDHFLNPRKTNEQR